MWRGVGLALDGEPRSSQTCCGEANRLTVFHRLPLGISWETFGKEIGDYSKDRGRLFVTVPIERQT